MTPAFNFSRARMPKKSRWGGIMTPTDREQSQSNMIREGGAAPGREEQQGRDPGNREVCILDRGCSPGIVVRQKGFPRRRAMTGRTGAPSVQQPIGLRRGTVTTYTPSRSVLERRMPWQNGSVII